MVARTRVKTVKQEANALLVDELVERFPALRPAYEEHLRDNNELLPHLFFWDVTKYAERLYASGETDTLQRLLNFLERAWADGPQEVEELIQVSFIESLGPWEDEKASMRQMLGPHLADAWSWYL